jgi:hypothetical protein
MHATRRHKNGGIYFDLKADRAAKVASQSPPDHGTTTGKAKGSVQPIAGELLSEVEQLRSQIEAIHSSTSWRITQPLRRLVTAARHWNIF